MINNINVSQSNTVEQVNCDIIDKLYFTTKAIIDKDNNKDKTTLLGNINTLSAYKDAVDYLRNNFLNLLINVVDSKYYIRFKDNTVFQILMNSSAYYGDGTGITENDAANMTISNALFENNTNIVSFDELKYFTKAITTSSNVKASISSLGVMPI